jgi:hypothetical protein
VEAEIAVHDFSPCFECSETEGSAVMFGNLYLKFKTRNDKESADTDSSDIAFRSLLVMHLG